MRKMLIIIGCLSGMLNFIAAQVIQGNVTDFRSHQPIEGATICIWPDNACTATDQSGYFTIKPAGIVNSMTCTAIGYQSRTIRITEFENNKNQVSLVPASIELSAVTVSPHT